MDSLAEHSQEWLFELSITKSGNTVSAYTTPLTHFLEYCAEQEKVDAVDLSTSDLPAFVRWLQRRQDYDKSTIALYTTALSLFFKYLLMEDVAGFSWSEYERLKERLQMFSNGWKKKRPKVPDPEDVEKLFAKVYEFKACPRDRILRIRNIALLECLRSTGARVSELAQLQVSDLNEDMHGCVVKGKGDKDRVVFFNDKSWEAIGNYLYTRQVPKDTDVPLWIRHDNAQEDDIVTLSSAAIRETVAVLCEEAGIPRITPHQFRHMFAIKILKHTNNLAVTQDMLGHVSPNTTRIYTQFMPEELLAIHREAINET